MVSETRMSRDASEVIFGSSAKTWASPRTARTVAKQAFGSRHALRSVRLNGGLETLEEGCFQWTHIRLLALPSSVRRVCRSAFENCWHLERADCGAAEDLAELGEQAFESCERLRQVLLGAGLREIGYMCFYQSGLEEVVLPGSLRRVGENAFYRCAGLKRVVFAGEGPETIGREAFARSGLESFVGPASLRMIGDRAFAGCEGLRHADLGACALQGVCGEGQWFRHVFEDSGLESVALPSSLRAVGDCAFAGCRRLRSVSFGEDSMLEEVGPLAFLNCGLEAFEAPPRLRRVGELAFAGCGALRVFRPNEGLRELGALCLWRTAASRPRMPPRARRTRAQLGLGRDPGVLRLPEGLDVVGEDWFRGTGIRKLVVPASVAVLGARAFQGCRRLRELVFEPGSRLEYVNERCFEGCALREVLFPRSLRVIDAMAFLDCRELAAVCFEEGSQLGVAGFNAFHGTRLARGGRFPEILVRNGYMDM